MNFCWITFYVKNMEESLKFYQDILGLEIVEHFHAGEAKEICMLGKPDGTKIELIRDKNQSQPVKTESLSIGFEVKSLDEALSLFKSHSIPIKRGPISPIPSTSFFFVDDPNGIEIQIVQHS